MSDADTVERVALLPCPFCGAEKMLTTTNEFGGFCLTCENCDAVGPPSEYDPEQMREAWNTRAAMLSPTVQEAARVLLNDDISLSRMSKAMHDGPLGADEYEYRASTKAGGWCLECVRAALRALTEQDGE